MIHKYGLFFIFAKSKTSTMKMVLHFLYICLGLSLFQAQHDTMLFSFPAVHGYLYAVMLPGGETQKLTKGGEPRQLTYTAALGCNDVSDCIEPNNIVANQT